MSKSLDVTNNAEDKVTQNGKYIAYVPYYSIEVRNMIIRDYTPYKAIVVTIHYLILNNNGISIILKYELHLNEGPDENKQIDVTV